MKPLVDALLVSKIMDPHPKVTITNETSQPVQPNINNGTRGTKFDVIGVTKGNYNDFKRDMDRNGVTRDRDGNFIIYKYGSYRRSVIILGIVIIFLQLCILGNL